jgi:hypothetical protein
MFTPVPVLPIVSRNRKIVPLLAIATL